MEGLYCRVVADSHHFNVERNPDPHKSEKSDPDLNRSKESEPEPHQRDADPQHCY
jgi:hypothetical protein